MSPTASAWSKTCIRTELKKQASDAQFSLKKQHAVIKIGKEPPVTVRIADVPDVQVSKADLDAYKLKIYQSNPWYRTPDAITEEISRVLKCVMLLDCWMSLVVDTKVSSSAARISENGNLRSPHVGFGC
jgi:hypothetical protein